jgi:phosphate transport system substrate-binding protein
MAAFPDFTTIIRAVAGLSVLVAACGIASADQILVQGSTTFSRRVMEPHQAEIEAKSGHRLTIIPNKSLPGLTALLEGRAHLAMISAPLEQEIGLLRTSHPGLPFDRLRAFEISRTRVSVVIHDSNPVRKIALGQLAEVLQGRITNWKALGGPDLPIRVVLVGGGGGVTAAVEAALLDGQPPAAPSMLAVKTPVQLVQVVEQERGAIGFAQLALSKQRKNAELATDKPIEQVLTLVTLGEPTPALQAVIEATRALAARMM